MKAEFQIHHIDLDRKNNLPSNLFRTDKHQDLHDQLRWLMNEWQLSTCKILKTADLVKYFIETGELVFEREYPRYRMNPVPGGLLKIYESVLYDLEIRPQFVKPPFNITLELKRFKTLPVARSLLEEAILKSKSSVRYATLRTTTKSTGQAERERERERGGKP